MQNYDSDSVSLLTFYTIFSKSCIAKTKPRKKETAKQLLPHTAKGRKVE